MKRMITAALLFAAGAAALAQTPATPNVPSGQNAGANAGPNAGPNANQRRQPGARAGMRNVPRVTGEIVKVEGKTYTVKTARGEMLKVIVPTGTPVMKPGRVTAAKADLKVGARINAMGNRQAGVTGNPNTGNPNSTDSTLTATRVMLLNPMAQGTIDSISARGVTLRAADGKTKTYTIDEKTRLMRNRQPAAWSDFKAGERISVEYSGTVATTIRPFTAPQTGPGMRQRRNGPNGQVGPNGRTRRNGARRNAPGAADQTPTGPRPAPSDDGSNDGSV